MTGRARPTVLSFAAVTLALLAAGGFVAWVNADRPKTVVDLQAFRETESIAIRSSGLGEGTATLVNLNPTVGIWYVLDVAWKSGAPTIAYHLEVPRPSVRLLLDASYPAGLSIVEGEKRHTCDVFSETSADRLDRARTSGAIFQPLCNARFYLRNRTAGHQTSLEATTDFLRERFSFGESLVDLGHHVMGDWNYETAQIGGNGAATGDAQKPGPRAALIDRDAAGRPIVSGNLGISAGVGRGGFVPGAWYAAIGAPGVYVSLLQPNMIDAALLRGGEKSVSALDEVEASALTYLAAFDLDQFDLGYAGGTSSPAVGWSAHMQAQMRDPTLPGPDGIGTIAPLVGTGLVNPVDAPRTVATFTGGYRRMHGAFLYGEFATKNHGSHYGFVENGTVLSTLQPGLATVFALVDGRVEMKTWSDADKALLQRVRFARQNGVPIVEVDGAGVTVPGPLVNQWGQGNWSGTEDRKLRTIRAGAAIQETAGKRFLIYAVFSAATPSAMARVFQAYQCRYAMLLDMNALEHTYMALYQRTGSSLTIEHLLKGMAQFDLRSGSVPVPRFTGYADTRDFFYVMRRNQEVHP